MATRRSALRFIHVSIVLLLWSCLSDSTEGQLSAAVASDKNVNTEANKFLQRKATDTADFGPGSHDFQRCSHNLQLRWTAEMASSIYATPLITDLYSDGRKDIVVPTFVKTIEVVEAVDGAKALGWPATHGSSLHSSPLLFDIDFDGVREVLVATFSGQILFFKENGDRVPEMLMIPRLKVRKLWYKGLDLSLDDDHKHADVRDEADDAFNNAHDQSVHQHEEQLQAHEEQLHAQQHNAQQQQNTQQQQQNAQQQQNTQQQQQQQQQKQQQQQQQHTQEAQPQQGQQQHAQPQWQQQNAQQQQQQTQQATQQQAQQQQQAVPTQVPQVPVGAVDEQHLLSFMKTLADYKTKYGEQAAKSVLENTKTVNPQLYEAVLRRQGQPVGVGGDDATLAGSRRSLMSFDDEQEGNSDLGTKRRLMAAGDGAGHEQVAEQDEHNKLSEEATNSFDVFENDDFGDDWINFDPNDFAQEHDLHADDQAPGDDLQFDELGDIMRDTPDKQQVMREMGVEEAEHDAHDQAAQHGAHVDPLDEDHFRYDNLYQDDYHFQEVRDPWDDDFEQKVHQDLNEFVMVDAHVLCTPAIGDLDQDGHEELVISVSYFFEKEYYDNPEHMQDPALKGLDLGKYVAGGVVVYDLRTRALRWSVHLDLSTEYTTYRAYIYSAPTLVDIDKDGKLEVIVGTSMGYIYVLDHTGKTLPGWPKQMGEVQGQVLAADFNNDGHIEVFASDAHGSIALWDSKGAEVAERHLKSMVSHRAMAADVNGDGELEIVFGTNGGKIYVVKGTNLDDVENFPFQTRGRILAPVLATRLADGPAQQLAVMSFDGFLYVVDGLSACADTVDIGETSYSMVLADDLDNNKKMELLVSTMNGNLYAFETSAPYHPLKTWTGEVLGTNNIVSRHDYLGVYATAASREPRDVAGDKMQIKVTIVDKRQVFAPNGSLVAYQGGPYNVQVVLKGVGVSEMNSGSQPVIGVADVMQKPGSYILELPCPRSRTSATVHVEMHDANRLYFIDEFSLSFNMHFHKLLKWIVALPLALMVLLLLGLKPTEDDEPALPSYHMS